MTYPAEELQRAIYTKIVNDAALKVEMGGVARAYDRVPPKPTFPYVSIPDAQLIDDGNTCEDNSYEGFVDLQVWSRAVGNVEAKRIAGALRAAILSGLTLPSWRVPAIQCTTVDHTLDPDGITARARLTFRFLIEPA